ncbi:alpha-amylase family glycosyl hydrolase [Anaerosporobacter sp.]
MKQLTKKIVFLMPLVLILGLGITACTNEEGTDATSSETDKNGQQVNTQAVICDDFSCISTDIWSIAIPESGEVAYITARKEGVTDVETEGNLLYRLTKKDGIWTNPEKITFDEGLLFYNAAVSVNGATLYVSVKTSSDSDINMATLEVPTIKDNKITKLKYLDTLNTKRNEWVGSVDRDGNLYYNTSSTEDYVSDLFLASYDGAAYNGIRLGNEVNRPSDQVAPNMYGVAVVPEGDELIYTSFTTDISSLSSNNLFTATKEEKSFKNSRLLSSVVNDPYMDVFTCNISGDGKTLYFLQQESYTVSEDNSKVEPQWYKVDLEASLKEIPEEEAKYGTDEYETADFPLELRNKSDETDKEGIYYEIFVRAFADSDGDGIGDFNGVTSKLDYLADLGVTGIWLMPINKTNSYHGYDVMDYYSLNDSYGTEEDFKNLLDEAHKRGIKVIMDLVINHTSYINPWFLQATSGVDNKYVNYYRIVEKDNTPIYSADDTSSWGNPVWRGLETSKYAYYGIFSKGMPDLNYNNPEVREEIKKVAKKWLALGVDGYRLDAAMHIYGDNEFKQQDDQLAHNIQWWNEFARACEEIKPDVYLVGEAWQDGEVLPEYVQPFDTKFNFEFVDKMMIGIKNESAMVEDNQNLSQYLESILDRYAEYDTKYLDGIFASNHDQNRVMSDLDNEAKAKLAANIYMTLSGNPYIYYGEELGMRGEGDDPLKRTAFKWNKDGSAPTADWMKAYSGEGDTMNTKTPSLEEQLKDENSMYQYYKDIIALRKSSDALMNGSYKAYDFHDSQIMAYERISNQQKVLVVHNFSNKTKKVSFDKGKLSKVLFDSNGKANCSKNKITLKSYSSIIIEY